MRWLLILNLFFLVSCGNVTESGSADINKNNTQQDTLKRINEKSKPRIYGRNWTLDDFYANDIRLNKFVDSVYDSMLPAEQAAQMIMVATSEYKGIGLTFPAVLDLYKKKIAGAVLFLKGRKSSFAREIAVLNSASARGSIFPAIFACDCEPSLYHRKFTDADSLPPASELKTIEDVQRVAKQISFEMKQLGLHWNLAPVADINSNKEIIDSRSFGENSKEIINKSIAFIHTSAENNIATALKHFPGHGAVKGDSHKSIVYIDSVFTELENFAAIIRQENPVSIMIGHIAVRNIPGFTSSDIPATLSTQITDRLLKDSLGYKGIVITDAMNMGAVKNIEDAEFKAVLAGNDLILIPEDARALHKRLLKLLSGDNKTRTRIAISVKKMIRLKTCLGILKTTNKE